MIERVAVAKMPTEWGDFDCHTYNSRVDKRTHMALTVGIDRVGSGERFPPIDDAVLVRVCVSDVGFLHALRDRLLTGQFGTQLADRFRE